MSETYEFTVTIGSSDDVDDRETAARLLQWAVSGSKGHEHINYVTVQFSEMDDAEADRLLDMIDDLSDEEIDKAFESLEEIAKDESDES